MDPIEMLLLRISQPTKRFLRLMQLQQKVIRSENLGNLTREVWRLTNWIKPATVPVMKAAEAFDELVKRLRSDQSNKEAWNELRSFLQETFNEKNRAQREYDRVAKACLNAEQERRLLEDRCSKSAAELEGELNKLRSKNRSQAQEIAGLKNAMTSMEDLLAERFSQLQSMMATLLSHTETMMSGLMSVQAAVEEEVAKQASTRM
ncbi:hypothetical protein M408DRAFT_26045 [Serendipita vermifera MAFF 305830]|uniref:Uncharacterized protein n=1 Tax=Serendipita vermifera MAFF 305830 TaxID=933852 RepID=A0A0C3AMB8_SERVB|nr:hypothetical protein M408DRAFT_26045 [Serendipita vermifera MAFF 305830]